MQEKSYEDIINLQHHVSTKHPHMSLEERSAQFAPFSALTGYEDCVEEAARLTDDRIDIGEDAREILNKKIANIIKIIDKKQKIKVTYFIPDDKKSGGKYTTIEKKIKNIDQINQELILINGPKIKLHDIIDISKE